MPAPIQFSFVGVPVSSTLTLLGTVSLNGVCDRLSLQVRNDGATTTNNFVLMRLLNDQGNYLPYLSSTAWTTAADNYDCSSSPPMSAIPAGQSGWADIDCGGAVSVELWASVAGGSTALSVFGAARLQG
jgi:hypothetical protein